MINSNDDNYYFTCRRDNEAIWGYLYDNKRMVRHNFEVLNFENSLQFNYLSSNKIKLSDYSYFEKNMQYDAITEDIDSIKTKAIVTKNQVNKKGKKKFRGKIELEYDNDGGLFPAKLLVYFGHHFLDHRELSFIENKLPTKVTFDYNNGIIDIIKLKKKLKINTSLIISAEQIVYKI